MHKVTTYLIQEIKQDKIRWAGLVIALVGGILGVILAFDGRYDHAGICGVAYILGLWLIR